MARSTFTLWIILAMGVFFFAPSVHAGCLPSLDDCNATPVNGCSVSGSLTIDPGTYNLPDGIYVCGDNAMLNCNGAVFTGVGTGIEVSDASNVQLLNCNVKEYGTGYFFNEAPGGVVSNSSASSSDPFTAVRVFYSSDIQINGNQFTRGEVHAEVADGLQLTSNTFLGETTNNWAAELQFGSNMQVSDNTITGPLGISVWGGTNNVVENNDVVNTNPAIYTNGIYLSDTPGTIVRNNMVSSHIMGIGASGKNITIHGNTVQNSAAYGIALGGGEHEVYDNTLTNNKNGLAVFSYLNDGSFIHDNTITQSSSSGIWLSYSTTDVLTNNRIHDNNVGVYSEGSFNVQLTNNDIYNNVVNLRSEHAGVEDLNTFNAQNNYWGKANAFGVQDCNAIDQSILDLEELPTSGRGVDFNPILSGPFVSGQVEDKCTPVLLVHGTYSDDGMWDEGLDAQLKQKGMRSYRVGVENGLKGLVPNNGNIILLGKQIQTAIASVRAKTGESQVDVLAHSMGGLATRVYTQLPLYANDVRKIVFSGTPQQGTALAKGFIAGLVGIVTGDELADTARKQQIPGSRFLTELNAQPFVSTISYSAIAGTKISDSWIYQFATWLIDPSFVGNPPEIISDNLVPVSSVKDIVGPCYEDYVSHSKVMGTSLYTNANTIQETLNVLQSKPTSLGDCSIPKPFSPSAPSMQFTTYSFPIPPLTTQLFLLNVKAGTHLSVASVSPDANVNLNLTTPSGMDLNQDTYTQYAGAEYRSGILDGNYFQWITIPAPQTGSWGVKVRTQSKLTAVPLTLHVARKTTMTMIPTLNPVNGNPGTPLSVSMLLQDGNAPALGASATVRITNPNAEKQTLVLFDDGLHGDGLANDGMYATPFTETMEAGYYQVELDANGTSGGDAYHFYSNQSAFREGGIDLMVNANAIAFSDSTPDVNQAIVITANIKNIGVAPSEDVNVMFYDGHPLAKGTLLGKVPLLNLQPNQTVPVDVNWIIPKGTHTVFVIIEPYAIYWDENFSNQMGMKTIWTCAHVQGNGRKQECPTPVTTGP